MEPEAETIQEVWQPVLIISPRRIDCGECGAKAIFIYTDEPITSYTEEQDDQEQEAVEFNAYCQDCWRKARAEEEYQENTSNGDRDDHQ